MPKIRKPHKAAEESAKHGIHVSSHGGKMPHVSGLDPEIKDPMRLYKGSRADTPMRKSTRVHKGPAGKKVVQLNTRKRK